MENEDDKLMSRQQAIRSRIHLVHIIHGMAMAIYFENTMSLGQLNHYSLAIVSAFSFFSEPLLGRRFHPCYRRLFYDLTMCTLTIIAAYNITLLAWREAPSDLNLMPLQARSLAEKMARGQIPFTALGTFITPVMLSSAGMSLRICKLATFLHACIYISTAVAVFMKTKSGSCVLDGSVENICAANFVHDLSAYTAILALAVFSCTSSAQISNEVVSLLRDGRHADSVLNHVLKNSIAGAASLVELGLENCSASESRDMFDSALEQLYRTMTWCASRQVMLDLASGKYVTSHSPVNVTKFLKGMIVEKGVQVTIRDSTKQVANKGQVDISFDEKLARLALENAKTNAISHGDGGHIELGAEFQNRGGTATAVVVLYVKNRLPPGFEISDEFLTDVVHRASGCDGHFDSSDNHHKEPVKLSRDSKSTRAGLPHIHLACQGAGGSFNLRRCGEDPRKVVCTIILPAQLTPRSEKGEVESSGMSFDRVAQFMPPPETVSGEDPPQASASTGGPSRQRGFQNGEELFKAASAGGAAGIEAANTLLSNTPSSDIPPGCKILLIDDSTMLSKGYKRIVLPLLNADPSRSEVVCPTNKNHVDQFLQNALGIKRSSEELDRADIVVIDQNIELDANNGTVYGTDLADHLRTHGFTGLILICSANAGDTDCAEYLRSGSVDGCISKDGSNKGLVASIHKEYALKKQKVACCL